MTPEEIILERLTTDTGVTAIVADRIYEVAAPDDTEIPYVTFHRTDTDNMLDLSGVSHSETAEIRIDYYFLDADQQEELSAAIRTAVEGYPVFFVGNAAPAKSKDELQYHFYRIIGQ